MELDETIQAYHKFLKSHGLSNEDIRAHSNLGKAYFVRQQPRMPFMLESFAAVSGFTESELNLARAKWVNEYPTRVLPLSVKEREIFLGIAATTGQSVPQKLRNGALISLLMLNRPRSIWPHHITGLQSTQLWFREVPLSGWPTNGAGAQPDFDKLKFLKYDFLAQGTDRRKQSDPYIALDEPSSDHLTQFVMNPEGWARIKHWASNSLFTGGPPGHEGETYKPITRQGVHKLLVKIGRKAAIKGTLTANILRDPPMKRFGDD